MTIQPSSAGTTGPLPCPFCGEPPTVEMGGYVIRCYNRKCAINPESADDDTDLALAVWNKRAPLSNVAAEASAQEKELFAAATKIDLAGALKHIRDWPCYIDGHHRQEYANLIEAQAKLIAYLCDVRAPVQRPTHSQLSELDDASNACLELAAKHGYATGHGDTVGDMIREFSSQIPNVAYESASRGDLTKLAAECHRAKWEFDLNGEEQTPSKSALLELTSRAFSALHRIGDMALKLRDASSLPSTNGGRAA